MDPIRVGQFNLGGTQRVTTQQVSPPSGLAEAPAAANQPAASVAGGVNELRSIGSRIAEIERAGFQAMARRDRVDDLNAVVAGLTHATPEQFHEVETQLASLEAEFGLSADQSAAMSSETLQARIDALKQRDAMESRARNDTLADLISQMRGAVGAQTGATASDFNASGAASALRAGLLGQPAPTPQPPSGGIEPKRSVELLSER